MNRVKPVYDVTLRLEKVLSQETTPKNRETIIEQVNQLVELRGKQMEKVFPPFSNEEIQLGELLLGMNRTIEEKMESLFRDLKLEMKQVKKQKKSNRTYINPYEKVSSRDGKFMDSRN
ncbi:flagellar protein FliT [Oceanobacillus manasiensis]|uniref:flagellar protein FliT n=1 Tax=Oceanobacillus manasiensis TaxID=586413 RepID=UPI0005A6B8AE|nr:flagellar protein FliT [Oceanobacillus manasiensis]